MKKAVIVVLMLTAAAFAANPFRPARSGSFAPQASPEDFQVGFWDSRQFDPLNEQPPLPEELRMDEYAGDGTGYYLVQFGGPVYGSQIDQLQRAGGGFLGFHSRYLSFVKMNRAVAGQVSALPFVRWVGVYQPGYKFWSRTLAKDGFGRVAVALFYPEDIEAAKAELEAMGLAVVRTGVSENMKVIEVDCSRGQLAAIARLNWVFSIEEWHPAEKENDQCQWVLQDWTQNLRNIWGQGIFGMDEILARIRTALRHRLQQEGERPIFRSGDLSVDLVRRIVTVRDKDVKLTPREYDLLRLLVAHAGKVLTHKFVLREVWGAETDVQYLRIYIRTLRQKIEADPEQPKLIQTEQGVGYRLRFLD